ncbi:RHS repeat domain-containing protein [Paenibacillus glufosinatiresistens]|uniref:RHS repeat domain-containing protein n=1 Tax=Paenibacillus glufosinatiresistens TaxID=3070657 RepID=UPI00286E83FA|nr:RHS repeat domain-containing protein [Paenibacillus sp. YX.27]
MQRKRVAGATIVLLLIGLLLSINALTAAAASYLYHYDSNGRLLSVERSDGSVFTYQYDANGNLMKRILVLGKLESPVGSEASSSNISVKGWYIDGNGIESIKVYINSEYQGLATYGDNREDIYTKYPSSGNHNSGYHFDAVLPNVTKDYEFKVVIRNKKGLETTLSKTIHYTKLNPTGWMDSPSASATSPYLSVSGWHLDKSGVDNLKVYVDGEYKGTAIYGDNREDVYKVYPQYGNHNSGYHLEVKLPNITKTYQVKVVAKSKDGGETSYIRDVNYNRIAPVGFLDNPLEGSTMDYDPQHTNRPPYNQMTVSGWYVDYTAVKTISVYIDGALQYSGPGSWYGRPDVYNRYPQYKNQNCGFSVEIPKPSRSGGRLGPGHTPSSQTAKTIPYTLKVVIENIFGEQMIISRGFNVHYQDPTNPGSWT